MSEIDARVIPDEKNMIIRRFQEADAPAVSELIIHTLRVSNAKDYPPEMLEHCNHILEHPEDVRDGHHIGIYNIVKATSLIYQEKAVFLFSNEPDAGARVDLYIPADKEESQ